MGRKEHAREAARLLEQAMALLRIMSVADIDGATVNDAADGIATLVEQARRKLEAA